MYSKSLASKLLDAPLQEGHDARLSGISLSPAGLHQPLRTTVATACPDDGRGDLLTLYLTVLATRAYSTIEREYRLFPVI
ncbi:hypothetical protein [Nitrosomonas nitrosa]|uniref:hypothetical protein n=1 Tax=Nitrosomonas nitrosa TaxID=52442 RepID=UPI0011B1F88A|nr:hypothetical protein [Nitrosomonas nitrosa]